MKIFFRSLLLAALIPSAVSAAEENLVKNPSFETIGVNGIPQNWETLQAGIQGNFHSVSKTAQDGVNAVQIDCDNTALTRKNYLLWIQRGLEKQLQELKPGTPLELSVMTNTRGKPDTAFCFYIEMVDADGKYYFFKGSEPLKNYVGWQRKSIRFEMPERKPARAYICFQLLSPGIVCFDNVRLNRIASQGNTPKAKLKSAMTDAEYGLCRVKNFPPRHTWYLPEKPGKLTVSLLPPPDADGKVRIVLKQHNGKELKTWQFRNQNEAVLELPVSDAGNYILQYSAGSYQDEEYFRIAPAAAKLTDIRFDQNHMMYVHGKPFFPIMFSCGAGLLDEDAFRIYREIGINSIQLAHTVQNAATAQHMDAVMRKYGFKHISMGNNFSALVKANGVTGLLSRLYEYQDAVRQMKNFIGFIFDEEEMLGSDPVHARLGYREAFFLMPEVMIWHNHAPRMTGTSGPKYGNFDNVKRMTAASDITGCDIYPVPEGNYHSELKNKTLSCVGEFTDLCRKLGYDQKPVWMMLQGGSWPEWHGKKPTVREPRPDYHQMRFMVYNALTHGARGIVFTGRGVFSEVYSKDFLPMAQLVKELNYAASFYTDGQAVQPADKLPDSVRMECRVKKSGDKLAVLVNEAKTEVSFDVPQLNRGRWFVLPEGKAWQTGRITLPPYGVLLLTTEQKSIPLPAQYQPVITDKAIRQPVWQAQWTCHPDCETPGTKVYARHSFVLDELPENASIIIAGDQTYTLKLNGKDIGGGGTYLCAFQYDLKPYLKKGPNLLEFTLTNSGYPVLLYEAELGKRRLLSGKDTEFSLDGKTSWRPAKLKGTPPVAPWGNPAAVKNVPEI